MSLASSRRRAIALTVTAAAVLLGVATMAAADADAAATSISAAPFQSTYGTGTTATIGVTTDQAATSPRLDVTAGPDAGLTGQACTAVNATNYNCRFTNRGGAAGSGTDTVRVYDDVDNSGGFTNGDPVTTTSVSFGGAIAHLVVTPPPSPVGAGNPDAVTATATDTNGIDAVGQTAYVTVAQTVTSSGGTATANPLTVVVTHGNNTTYSAATCNGSTCTYTASASGTVNPSGNVYATVTSSAGGAVTITAANTAASPTVTGSAGFTVTGGRSGDAAVHQLNIDPEADTYSAGDSAVFDAYAGDVDDDPVGSATVHFVVTSGPDPGGPTVCGTTAQFTGKTTCTLANDGGPGVDTITFFVDADGSGAPSAGDPQRTVTITFAQQPAYDSISVTCFDPSVVHGAADQDRAACVSPAGDTGAQSFDVLVEQRDSTGLEMPVPNAIVHVSVSGSAATVLGDPGTTNAVGETIFAVTPTASPGNGDALTLTAVVGTGSTYTGQGSGSASATVTYQAPTPFVVALTPGNQPAQVGATATVTATVTDQFADPVPSTPVSFEVSGRNNVTSPTLQTDAQGNAAFTYPDAGSAGTEGTDTVQATAPDASTPNSPTATVTWLSSITPTALVLNLAAGTTPSCVDSGGVTTASADVGTTTAYTLCATVLNAAGEALPGLTVTTTDDSYTVRKYVTSTNGTVTAPLSSTTSGERDLHVTVGSLSQDVTITYAPGPAVRVLIEPDGSLIAPGGTRTYTAYPQDRYGNFAFDPTDAAENAVAFSATGPGSFSGARTVTAYATRTDPATATLTMPAGSNGSGAVTAALTVYQGSTAPSSYSDYTVGTPLTGSVGLDRIDPVVVRQLVTVTASVIDIYGAPIPGAVVSLATSGAQRTTGQAVTNSAGLATFSFRATAAGRLMVAAKSGGVTAPSTSVTVAKQPVSMTFGVYSPARGQVTLVALVSPASGVVVGQRVGFYQRAGAGYVGPIVAVVDNRGRAQITVKRPSHASLVFRAVLATSANVVGATTGDRRVTVR